jgi:hypothetical protein
MRKSVFVASIAIAVIAGLMIAGSSGWASSTHSSSANKLRATVYNPSASRKSSGKKGSAGTTSSASQQNPCTLVTASEAGALFHAEVQRETEAPLGPTCILQVKGQKHTITFAVEKVNVAAQVGKMKQKRAEFTIGGHAAYCGSLGAPLLYVKVSGGRALEVTASCATARALASSALPRIRG